MKPSDRRAADRHRGFASRAEIAPVKSGAPQTAGGQNTL